MHLVFPAVSSSGSLLFHELDRDFRQWRSILNSQKKIKDKEKLCSRCHTALADFTKFVRATGLKTAFAPTASNITPLLKDTKSVLPWHSALRTLMSIFSAKWKWLVNHWIRVWIADKIDNMFMVIKICISTYKRHSLRAWRSGDRNPVGARFSAPVQTGPGAHPASCTMGNGSFPWVKRPRRGAAHPLPSSAEVEGRVELYIYSPSGPSWPVIGWTLPL